MGIRCPMRAKPQRSEAEEFSEKVRPRWAKRGFMAAAVLGLAVEPIIGCSVSTYSSGEPPNVITKLLDGAKKDDAKDALETATRHADDDTKEAIARIAQNYERAAALSKRLGLPEDALTRLNMAYGIAAVGEKKAEELHKGLGIQFFLRYPRSILEEVHHNMLRTEISERPLMLVIFNKNDWNGHFYREGMALAGLERYYKVMIVEADSEDAFYSKMRSLAKSYGRIDTLILAGHGAPDSIQLGDNDDKGEIDLTDSKELAELKGSFVPVPTVVLASCSTGQDDKSIAALLSRAWEANVFAPVKAITKIEYHLDDSGRLASVSYDVESRQFAK
jgi:hypothetical protein